VPFVLPYAAYVGIAALADGRVAREWDYAARIVVTAALLLWARRRWLPLRGPRPAAGSVAAGVVAGLVGVALWVLLLAPFANGSAPAWSGPAWGLRVVAAVLLVPLFEEQLLRGLVLRLVVQAQRARRAGASEPLHEALDTMSVRDVEAGACTPLALLVSSVLFAVGHPPREIPAALVYGLLMGFLWIRRKDLLSCVVAHAVTNCALALYVLQGDHWAVW